MQLEGLIAATFTPFDRDGKIDISKIKPMVDKLVTNRISGIYICGSTGEGHSLTVEERKALAAAFIEASAGRVKTIVNVGHNCLEDACALTKHAAAVGADAISAAPPTYYKIGSVPQLVEVLSKITGAAPDVPFFYYHIPALTRVELDMPSLLQMGEERLPSLAGIKFTAPNIHELQACLAQSRERYEIIFGMDEMLLSALTVGARCMIGSTYNFMPDIYHGIIENFGNGNMEAASALQGRAVGIIRAFLKFSSLPAQKSIMRMAGMDCGPVRLPLVDLTDDEEARLRAALDEYGLFERAAADKPGIPG